MIGELERICARMIKEVCHRYRATYAWGGKPSYELGESGVLIGKNPPNLMNLLTIARKPSAGVCAKSPKSDG